MLPHMELTALTFVVIAANVLGAAMAIPQVRRLLRTRRTDGVSVAWAAVSAAVNGWWGAYGVATGDHSIVPVSVVSVVSYVTIALGVVRFSPVTPRSLVAPVAGAVLIVSTVPVIALVIDGWATAGITLGALYGVQLSPAVVAVYRVVDVSGVAPATWTIAFAEAALWGVYGFATTDIGLLTLAATGVIASSLVLMRLFLRRTRSVSAAGTIDLTGFAPV